MKLGIRVSGWRSLVGMLGVGVLALGLSLKLEGAPSAPRPAQPADRAVPEVARETTTAKVESLSASQTPPTAPLGDFSRVQAGTIPAVGLRVLRTIHVDYRDDEGTRRRQAGTLIGPMPSPRLMGGVATGGDCDLVSCTGKCPGDCSFAIHCDDNDPCTIDSCDFVPGAEGCSGMCVNDPVATGESGRCDDGAFCNGQETCQGAVCAKGSLRNLGQPCDSHGFCGEAGACSPQTRLCTAPPGRIEDSCTKDEDCSVVGRCQGGPTPNDDCISDATCGPGGTCNSKVCDGGPNDNKGCLIDADCTDDPGCPDGNCPCVVAPGISLGRCLGGGCLDGTPAICCQSDNPAEVTVCAEFSPRCDEASRNPGATCKKSADCGGGLCERCLPACTSDPECSDGQVCNGDETCQRTCDSGTNKGDFCTLDNACPNGACADKVCVGGSDDGQACTTTSATCLVCADKVCVGGANDGKLCPASAPGGVDCTGGACEEKVCAGGRRDGKACVSPNPDCPDGSCIGLCKPGLNPCGAGALCVERYCLGSLPPVYCLVDRDCAAGNCVDIPTKCYLGRCCQPGATQLTCTKKDLATCDNIVGSLWYMGDGGQQTLSQQCGGSDPRNLLNEPWECPQYTSGITQLAMATPPIFPVIAGPISNSVWCVPAPGGPGGACDDVPGPSADGRPDMPLHLLGDDYKFFTAAKCVGGDNNGQACTSDSQCLDTSIPIAHGRCGSYLAMDVMRFVGVTFPPHQERVSIDFYDEAGRFIEDIVVGAANGAIAEELGISVLIFTPSLTIPASGWVVMRVAEDFAPSMRFGWASTSNRCVGGTNPGAACGSNADCAGGGTCSRCVGGTNPNAACDSSTDCTGDGTCVGGGGIGGNNPNRLWINCNGFPSCEGHPPTSDNNFLKMCNGGPLAYQACVTNDDCPDAPAPACPGGECTCVTAPGIMAFELVGDKVEDPVGACCVLSTGECRDGVVDWECTAAGDVYRGDDTLCSNCNGGPNAGKLCRTCTGTTTPCTRDGDCTSPKTCDADNAQCPPGFCTTSGVPCFGNGDCAGTTGPCVTQDTCSTGLVGEPCNIAGTRNCSGLPANTVCTGPGQGTCPGRTCAVAPYASCTSDLDCPLIPPDNVVRYACQLVQTCAWIQCNLTGSCSLGVIEGTCTAGVCAIGYLGKKCESDNECDVAPNTCDTGDLGHACTLPEHCNVAGTCVAVSCAPLPSCGEGACCNPITGACTIGSSGTCDGTCDVGGTDKCVGGLGNDLACAACQGDPDCECKFFQGFGTDCDADDGYDDPQQHCCPMPKLTGLRCMSGPKNLQDCTPGVPDPCSFCVGGSKNGLACTVTSHATTGCLDEGDCVNLVCVGGLPPNPNVCLTDADCPDNSGFCRGHCVNRGTGGDNCEDAVVHSITVPDIAAGPKTVTITGNNLGATSSEEEPDSCTGAPTGVGSDPGWWEAFSIDKCARVRVDFCCSDPVRQPQWDAIVSECDPTRPQSCGGFISSRPDPYKVGEAPWFRGGPYCPDDNLWRNFGLLEPGTYYLWTYAVLAGAHGPYQYHVTVEACPTNACCFLACTGGPSNDQSCVNNLDCGSCTSGPVMGAACNSNEDCGKCVGGTRIGLACDAHTDCPLIGGGNSTCTIGVCTPGACDSKCTALDKPDCDDKTGYLLAPPNIPRAVPQCIGTPCEDVLKGGACCTGPGICKDSRENDRLPMTQEICERDFQGTYVGGVRCKGGVCVGGTHVGLSCNDIDTEPPSQCVGSTCGGTTQEKAQQNPCPVCTMVSQENCQTWENDDKFSPSDLSAGSGAVWADDFVLTADGTLNSVCVWGVYVVADITLAGAIDCGGPEEPGTQFEDVFRVRVWEDDGGKPGGGSCSNSPTTRCFVNDTCPVVGGIKGTCLSRPFGESTCTREKALVPGAASASDLFPMWTFQLALTAPITGLVKDERYWLEVTNNTSEAEYADDCVWHWSQLRPTSTQGNLYSAAGSETNGYGDASQRGWDMAWCLDLDVTPEAGGVPIDRACCTCQGVCTPDNLNDCDDASADWNAEVTSCGQVGWGGCEAPANDNCADAPVVPVGLYSVSTQCATTDGANPASGRINSNVERDIWFFYRPSRNCRLRADSCSSSQDIFFDSAIAIYSNNSPACPCPVSPGDDSLLVDGSDDDCVTLGRACGGIAEYDAIAGNCYTIRVGGFPGDNEGGRTAVDIKCGEPFCGDGRKNGTDVCDGLDNANCRTAVPSKLCGPTCTCSEPNPCGTGGITAGEDCDPGCTPSLPGCPAGGGDGCGANSDCRLGGDPLQCTCTSYCGNNSIENPEECDGDDDAGCPDRCQNDCKCPPPKCGDGRLARLCSGGTDEGLPCEIDAGCTSPGICVGEECEFGECSDGAPCGPDLPCASGICTRTTDQGQCSALGGPGGNCRTPTDPLGGCRCGCEESFAPPIIKWSEADQASRSLRFEVNPPATAAGSGTQVALQVTMVDLQTPNPPNQQCCPAPNFHLYDVGTCTAAGEGVPSATNSEGGCARWVGEPGEFREAQDVPAAGTFIGARLQCTPFYHDWTAYGKITVLGAEILPSSTYSVEAYGAGCKGAEYPTCPELSDAVTMKTHRSGDVVTPFNLVEPSGLDINEVINKFKGLTSTPKALAQLTQNVVDPYIDVGGLDISAVIDAFKSFAYSHSGPCPCPSTVTCGPAAGSVACASLQCKTCVGGGNAGKPCSVAGDCTGGACSGTVLTCVKTCLGGDNIGDPCIKDIHCPPVGNTCGNPFCRDRCGRCK